MKRVLPKIIVVTILITFSTSLVLNVYWKFFPKYGLTPIIASPYSSTNNNYDNEISTKFEHIFLIVLENKSNSQIVNNLKAPYFSSLIKDYKLVTNYHGVAHPSLPNYIALIGGDTFNITSNCINCFISKPNLIDNLKKSGYSWKAYMESMPQRCFIGDSALYKQKHNPFIYFDDIRNDKNSCDNIVPLSEFASDISGNYLANFIWITPNLCNDMHDCSINHGDKWLSELVPVILDSAVFKNSNSLLAILWDEDDGSQINSVPLLIAASTAKVIVNEQDIYTHYSLLHTIELLWNLPTLTENDRNASVFGFEK